MGNSGFNTFYNNDIINNTIQLNQSVGINTWDNGRGKGNYWSDYTGIDMNGNGIGDTKLPHQGVDYYPLTETNIYGEEVYVPSLLDLLVFGLIFLLIFILVRIFNSPSRKKKSMKKQPQKENEQGPMHEEYSDPQAPSPPSPNQQEKP